MWFDSDEVVHAQSIGDTNTQCGSCILWPVAAYIKEKDSSHNSGLRLLHPKRKWNHFSTDSALTQLLSSAGADTLQKNRERLIPASLQSHHLKFFCLIPTPSP